jgi:hypothetical protein
MCVFNVVKGVRLHIGAAPLWGPRQIELAQDELDLGAAPLAELASKLL